MSFSLVTRRERRRDTLDEFPSEAADRETPTTPTSGVRVYRQAAALIVAAAIGVGISGIAAVARLHLPGAITAGSFGILAVESEPKGASIYIDGRPNGATPASVRLAAGTHQLLVRRGNHSQQLQVTITSNTSVVHHFMLPSDATATGNLRVISEGPRGEVKVDGVKRGMTPLMISNLNPGDHEVVVVRATSTERRTIRIDPNTTTSLVMGAGATPRVGPESGWLVPQAHIPLQIVENDKVVGTTESERILVPSGEHTFEFKASALGFSALRKVSIHAGQTQNVVIDLPTAPLSINATPWADVWVDGDSLGSTPIGKVMTTIGPHELVFRHPQLGERRITTVVTLIAPARASVDMTTQP